MRTPNVSEAKEKIQVIKYLDVGDMTITGSGKVSDKAFYAAKENHSNNHRQTSRNS